MAKNVACFAVWFPLAMFLFCFVAEGALECDGKCYSSGDPHYQTFDCKKFEFHGKCSYVLMQTCDEELPFIQIIGDNEPLPYHPDLAFTKNVIIRTTDEDIRLTSDKYVFVNDEEQKGTTIHVQNGIILKTDTEIVINHDFGLKVKWGSPFKAEITLTNDNLKGKVCGICGNANGDPEDDFVAPTSQQIEDAVSFAESWNMEENCNPSAEKLTTGGVTEKLTTGGVTEKLTTGGVTEKLTTGGVTEILTKGGVTEMLTKGGVTETLTTGGVTEKLTTGGVTEMLTTGGVTASKFKLVGGFDENEGSLKYFNGSEWIDFCQYRFSMDIGKVICRELGLPEATEAGFGTRFQSISTRSAMNNITLSCDGNETHTDDCTKVNTNPPWYCFLAWVKCREGIGEAKGEEGELRLIKGDRPSVGLAYQYKDGEWKSFCSDNIKGSNSPFQNFYPLNMAFMGTLCRTLGYVGATTFSIGAYSHLADQSLDIDTTVYSCSGLEQSISECQQTNIDTCSSGATGANCQEIDYCKNVSCKNGGSCINEYDSFRCFCPDFYSGVYCEEEYPCERDWKYHNNRCYQFALYNKTTYEKAEQECERLDGTLLLIKEAIDKEFINDVLAKKPYSNGHYLIGVVAKSGEWTWVNGTKVTYADWISSEYPRVDRGDCAVINRKTGWRNYHCDTGSFGYICEKEGSGSYPKPLAPPPGLNEGDVILMHGSDPSEGILHVVHDGELGTVCDDRFDNRIARMVCRQLGYPGGKVVDLSTFGYAGKGRIWLDELSCQGNENSLLDCVHNALGITGCDHREDVAISCSKEGPRLSGGETPLQGRIEYLQNGEWGTVCGGDDWGQEEADVACKEMGFFNATQAREEKSAVGSGKIGLSELACTGNESALTECAQAEWGTNTCSHGDDARVECSEGNFRLVGMPNDNQGILQVYHAGQWGYICAPVQNFESLVCQRLGFSKGGGEETEMTRYDVGWNVDTKTKAWWKYSINCPSSAETIEECTARLSYSNEGGCSYTSILTCL